MSGKRVSSALTSHLGYLDVATSAEQKRTRFLPPRSLLLRCLRKWNSKVFRKLPPETNQLFNVLKLSFIYLVDNLSTIVSPPTFSICSPFYYPATSVSFVVHDTVVAPLSVWLVGETKHFNLPTYYTTFLSGIKPRVFCSTKSPEE